MAIFGNGTGMGFAICGSTQSVTSWESTVLNYFSVTILPATPALTGGFISGGTISINFNGAVSAIALSAINRMDIRPTFQTPARYNPQSGKSEVFDPVYEVWR